MKNKESIFLSDYAAGVAETDVLDANEFGPVLQGLYGEVGGIMATAKKLIREQSAYVGYRKAAEEEFGDTLWYLAAICRRMGIRLEDVFDKAISHGGYEKLSAASDVPNGSLAYIVQSLPATMSMDETLIALGKSAAKLLEKEPLPDDLVLFAKAYLDALHATQLVFSNVVRGNLQKARGAFLYPNHEELERLDFDKNFDEEEQLPRKFNIRINQRGSGKSYLQWNGVFIGDPLTDNIADQDGYRFHDVFHFAYASILHWSPVMRGLIKHKRKSRPDYDEEQDSGRAIVVEEGLSAWIFCKAKEQNFFENQSKISLGILKTVKEFVSGYEVEKCPLKLWEKAILDGYTVFRQLKTNQGGWIIGDREQRTIDYKAL